MIDDQAQDDHKHRYPQAPQEVCGKQYLLVLLLFLRQLQFVTHLRDQDVQLLPHGSQVCTQIACVVVDDGSHHPVRPQLEEAVVLDQLHLLFFEAYIRVDHEVIKALSFTLFLEILA